jgi:hypothetical protein
MHAWRRSGVYAVSFELWNELRLGTPCQDATAPRQVSWLDGLAVAPRNGGPIAFLCLPKCHLFGVSQFEIQR